MSLINKKVVTDRTWDNFSSYRIYLTEASSTELLTVEQEIELANRKNKGDEEAREILIKANLRLVVYIVLKDFAERGYGLSLLDMINEGNIGLMKAVDRFDPLKGAKVSTYAAWWIKQNIKRAIADKGKVVRVPVHACDDAYAILTAYSELKARYPKPSFEQLARKTGFSVEKVKRLYYANLPILSLDQQLNPEDDTKFGDCIPDTQSENAQENAVGDDDFDFLKQFIGELDEKEREIITLRFGLDGGPEKTLEEVGQKFGVTRERIRQIQNAILKKLRLMFEKTNRQQDPDLVEFHTLSMKWIN